MKGLLRWFRVYDYLHLLPHFSVGLYKVQKGLYRPCGVLNWGLGKFWVSIGYRVVQVVLCRIVYNVIWDQGVGACTDLAYN